MAEFDSRYDKTLGGIPAADVWVAIDAARGFKVPQFTAVTEGYKYNTGTTQPPTGAVKSINLTTQPQWTQQSSLLGLKRIVSPDRGIKFGHSFVGPDGVTPAYLFSSYKTDLGSRFRSEVGWRGPDVEIPLNTVFFMGARYWYDFEMGADQHVCIMQLHHGSFGADMNPCFAISLHRDTLNISVWSSDADPLAKVAPVFQAQVPVPPKKRWFELVLKGKFHWDASYAPYLQFFVSGVKVAEYAGPNVYKSTPQIDIAPEFRVGNYPGDEDNWNPDCVRDVWISKAVVALKGLNTAGSVRQALMI